MQIIRAGEDVRPARRGLEGTLALVPTMGALHEGHLSLVREARSRVDRVAATIFVNPMQFGENEDFGRYPRQEERDLKLLEAEGCDIVWLPRAEDIYPAGFATSVSVKGVSERWEGEARPGHFDGVATVVAKLLIAMNPDMALFGEKDFQQLAVIRRMVTDLGLAVQIESVPTVRDADSLALSSRNAYLTKEERDRAAALPWALRDTRKAILAGVPLDRALEQCRNWLLSAGPDHIDYLALVDSNTLEPLTEPRPGARLIAAWILGSTRLIDNLAI